MTSLEHEEAGEENLFDIDLLTAMRLLEKAWDEVTPETIQNCWQHSGVVPNHDETWEDIFINADAPSVTSDDSDDEMDVDGEAEKESGVVEGWKIILEFAQSGMTLPEAEKKLKSHLGSCYKAADWQVALFAVTGSETSKEALAAVQKLMPVTKASDSRCSTMGSNPVSIQQIQESEIELMECVKELYSRGHLENVQDVNNLVDPAAEREDADNMEVTGFDDSEAGLEGIWDYVLNKTQGPRKDGEDEDDEEFVMDSAKVLEAARYLETVCENRGDLSTSFELSQLLRRFRGEVRRETEAAKKQMPIESFFSCT
ncbi:hypothetical protein AAF712_009175 [Marasmius tenuissimus]|uniref:Uncharacterized protein n=1 Tax=Marasmius tenuissimus TaxID=585030 RepID=A0ABR2ZR65_9AGAR